MLLQGSEMVRWGLTWAGGECGLGLSGPLSGYLQGPCFHTLGGQRSQPEVMPRQLSPQPQLEFLPWAVTQPEARSCPG